MSTLMSSSSRAADSAAAPAEPGDLASRLRSLHDDPHQIHQLLGMLGMPPGTEVRVTTVAASMIVR